MDQQKRANPLGDLGDLIQTKPTRKPVELSEIEALAQSHNFVSREPASKPPVKPAQAAPKAVVPNRPRRARVKREPLPQLNIRMRAEIIQEFYDLADDAQVTLAEMFEVLLATYTKKPKR